MKYLIICLIILASFHHAISKTKEEWKGRAVYQILTDRFARSDGKTAACNDLRNYCGGSFKGIERHLDYIKDLGFDAIWISPIVENAEGGYHGYWTTNFYKINLQYGSEQDFKDLVKAAHARDIWVMVDIVANHVADLNENFKLFDPFNKPEHYHEKCAIHNNDWKHNQWRVENCRFANLPDINQDNPWVKQKLLEWIRDLVKKYDIDGIRIDTVMLVPKWFWAEFSKASGVYTVGEVCDERYNYVASYQGPLDAVLNYNLYFVLKNVWGYGQSMHGIRSHYDAMQAYTDQSVLGNFLDNHDQNRFLSFFPQSKPKFLSAIAFSLTSIGIPMMYYGTEFMYAGGGEPANREVLWTVLTTVKTDVQDFVRTLLKARQKTQFWKDPQVEKWVDDNFYAFTRGKVLVTLTNTEEYVKRRVKFLEYPVGTVLCNIFHPQSDCLKVENGEIDVILLKGEVKIFVPKTQLLELEMTSDAEEDFLA
eukprot:TRINITY_DN432_c0_g2_i7.p1 TRINITY_DN432_c0_g2~~TRINITY_DN432_c0_g2_i7.p1  ORF type:complete len:479 (-),score=130.19 TRINITY_DN432_c0_g2_i7:214-1650(-)